MSSIDGRWDQGRQLGDGAVEVGDPFHQNNLVEADQIVEAKLRARGKASPY
jgi:hypothetical protein